MKNLIFTLCLLVSTASLAQDVPVAAQPPIYEGGYVPQISTNKAAETWSTLPPITEEEELQIMTATPVDNSFHLQYWSATWCGPCRGMKPKIKRLEKEWKVKWYDVDKHSQLSRLRNIRNVPTFIVFKNGVEVERIKGANSYETLDQLMREHEHGSDPDEDDVNIDDDELDRLDSDEPEEIEYDL